MYIKKRVENLTEGNPCWESSLNRKWSAVKMLEQEGMEECEAVHIIVNH
jgi:hypothetical protein